MEKNIVEEILSKLAKEIHQIRPYAGAAFLTDDKSEMKFWKGQYTALEGIRKFVEEKRLGQLVEEEQAAELFKSKQDGKITFAEHVKKQIATLLPHDHHLFDEIVKGLVKEG